MNRQIKFIATTLVVSASLLVSTIAYAQSSKASLSSARQKQLVHMVKQDCGSCHGMTLKGGLGPALTKQALKDKPVLFIKNTIIYGRPGTAMPPWNTILTDQEALWISQQLLQGMKDDK